MPESRRDLEERRVERPFLQLCHQQFGPRICLLPGAVRHYVGNLRSCYRLQGEACLRFSRGDEFNLLPWLFPIAPPPPKELLL